MVLIVMVIYFLGIVSSFGVLIAEELENLIGYLTAKQWHLAFSPVMVLMSLLPKLGFYVLQGP